MRLDLGLTSPQAQWLAKGGSGLSSGNLQQINEDGPDVANNGFLDSPYKHRWHPKLQLTMGWLPLIGRSTAW